MRAILLILALLGTLTARPANAQPPRRGFLFTDARGDLAAARARGEKDVLLVIASMPGANANVARLITTMGGAVQFRDDDVDYLRARVPLDQVDALATHADVHSVNISSPPQFPAAGGVVDTRAITLRANSGPRCRAPRCVASSIRCRQESAPCVPTSINPSATSASRL